ncbi:hypothetical protein LCGC14_0171050 [marine sediment metagenome]|jgi:hypothetical protein|uniref:Uncharacterized protein n=1 Tax=marine sediment metagenome TaxID=412755 RepID=A0A0F9USW0_9ZZZZ
MNTNRLVTDLFRFESDRAMHLHAHRGSLKGFASSNGRLLQEALADDRAIRAHLEIPAALQRHPLPSGVRRALAEHLSLPLPQTMPVSHEAILRASEFVEEVFDLDLSHVQVVTADPVVMQPDSMGVVYSHGYRSHVVVAPSEHFDPCGMLVYQFAIAAHYVSMRSSPELEAMITDHTAQAMVGFYATVLWSQREPGSALAYQLRNLARWEVASGLSNSAKMPMGFIVSDLGVSLLKDYGGDLFRSIVTELYEILPDGQGIWFGATGYAGALLGIGLASEEDALRSLMVPSGLGMTLEERLGLVGFADLTGLLRAADQFIGHVLGMPSDQALQSSEAVCGGSA